MAERTAPWALDGVPTGSQEARLAQESMVESPGVVGGSDLAVTSAGGMSLSVAAGRAFIRSSTAYKGMYHVVNDAAKTVTVQASEANPRIDLVIAEVTASSWNLRVVKGTAAASPTAPATPADSIVIARVNLTALAGAVTAAMLEDYRTFASMLRLATDMGWRNWLRNGDMTIWQRGVGPLATYLANPQLADGWTVGGTGGTVSHQRSTLALGNASGLKYGYLITPAGQAAAGDYCQFSQKIEGVDSLAGQQVTLSFYAAASAGTPKLAVEVIQSFGTGGAPSADVITAVKVVTIAAGPALVRYQVTFTVPSITGKTLGTNNNDYLQVGIWVSAGTTFAARSLSIGVQNFGLTITGLQIELGPVATPMERIPFQAQMAWCQRYLYLIYADANQAMTDYGPVLSATQALLQVVFPAIMRAIPSMSGPTAGSGIHNGSAFSSTTSGYAISQPSQTEAEILATGTGVTGSVACIRSSAPANRLMFSAEL